MKLKGATNLSFEMFNQLRVMSLPGLVQETMEQIFKHNYLFLKGIIALQVVWEVQTKFIPQGTKGSFVGNKVFTEMERRALH